MTGQASVVEVLRAHRYTWHEGPGAGFRCRCDGWTDGSLWHHQADMLAAAGLLASGPTLAEVWDEGFTRGFYAAQGLPLDADASESTVANPYDTTEGGAS